MAGTPGNSTPHRRRPGLLLCLCVVLSSGCEMGRTMFEYSSGGSPWIGIDLVPRRKSPTTIRHAPVPGSGKQKGQAADVHLVEHEQGEPSEFKKKPLRLNLPASRETLQPTRFSATRDVDFSVSSFTETRF